MELWGPLVLVLLFIFGFRLLMWYLDKNPPE